MNSWTEIHFCVRNPNYPLQVEQVLNTEKEAKRFKMVNWEPYNNKKRYLEIGERWLSYVITLLEHCLWIDLKPRMKDNYRSRAASLWLNLVPQLENSGTYDWSGQSGPHGMLTGETWGLVKNRTSVPGVQQISLGDKVNGASCQEGDQMSAGEPSTGKSQLDLNSVILVSLVAGTSPQYLLFCSFSNSSQALLMSADNERGSSDSTTWWFMVSSVAIFLSSFLDQTDKSIVLWDTGICNYRPQ